jgi:serine/threonine protein phosphatase PrpC
VDDHDFIVMGSDGLWDKFDNTEAVELMRQAYEKEKE